MARYQLEIKTRAVKELSRVHPDIGRRLIQSIESLAAAPRPRQSHKLSESENSYRLRVGEYRVLYQVDDEARLVTVFKVGTDGKYIVNSSLRESIIDLTATEVQISLAWG